MFSSVCVCVDPELVPCGCASDSPSVSIKVSAGLTALPGLNVTVRELSPCPQITPLHTRSEHNGAHTPKKLLDK